MAGMYSNGSESKWRQWLKDNARGTLIGAVAGVGAGIVIGAIREYMTIASVFRFWLFWMVVLGVAVGVIVDYVKFRRAHRQEKVAQNPVFVNGKHLINLPGNISEFISETIRKMRYRKKVRAEVAAELVNHFEDELKDCKTEEEK